MEVLCAPASDEQEACLVRVLTSAEGREVEASTQVECWVAMSVLRPQSSRDEKQGACSRDVTSGVSP